MRKVLGLAGAVALGSLTLVSTAAAVEITLYHYQANRNYEAFRKILDDFEAQNPDVTVADVYSQSTQITADVQTALAAGRPVDVATVIGKNVRYFIENTPAVPLNCEPEKAAFLENYMPNFLDIGRDGEDVFAVPHAYGTPMMF